MAGAASVRTVVGGWEAGLASAGMQPVVLEPREQSAAATMDGRMRDAVTAVGEAIAGGVVQLRQTGREEIEVTVQPDDRTEIRLRLVWQHGNAEVQAELRRGDGASMTGRWQELQERLAQQGVKLGALQTSTGGLGNGGGGQNFTRPDTRTHREEPALRRSRAAAGTRRSVARPEPAIYQPAFGWETWA